MCTQYGSESREAVEALLRIARVLAELPGSSPRIQRDRQSDLVMAEQKMQMAEVMEQMVAMHRRDAVAVVPWAVRQA